MEATVPQRSKGAEAMEPELTQPADENAAFQQAVAAFAAEEKPKEETPAPVTPPTPVVEGAVAETPEPVEADAQPSSPEIAALQKKLDSLEREARKEREAKNYWMQNYQQVAKPPEPQKQTEAATPVAFTTPRPKRDDFNGDDTAWVQADNEWVADRKAAQLEQKFFEQQKQLQIQRQQEEQLRSKEQYENSRVQEGRNKYGQEFTSLAHEVSQFAAPGTEMYETLFSLRAFPDVVVELGRNLQEAERISQLEPRKIIYELQALERRLVAQQELRAKTPPKTPTKVEQPGTGLGPQAVPGFQKLKKEALESGGDMDAFAKVFMLETPVAR